MMNFKITGTGSYLPNKILTNQDLSEMVDTNDEWIIQRVGVKTRHVAEEESAEDMAVAAAEKALEMSGVSASELDLIVVATFSGSTIIPSVAGVVQQRIGAVCPSFDISSACSGFIFALDTAAGFFERGKAKKALVIGTEKISKFVDWNDRNTCVIFGDGAGAAVLEEGDGYLSSYLFTKGGNDVIEIPAYGGISPFDKVEHKRSTIFMNGQETFKFAVKAITSDLMKVVHDAGLELEDIDYIVPHQANMRIIQYAVQRLKIPQEKFFVNIEKYGNTSAASVPIALDELNRSGKLKKGMSVAMSAFGGGLSSGACVLKWYI
ncbi:MAG: beta-ketoacyl-ACP synthase III [Bacillota bacterium]|nr:beta-ketoacyl-ACP synthase III [Bacillota bacterium]